MQCISLTFRYANQIIIFLFTGCSSFVRVLSLQGQMKITLLNHQCVSYRYQDTLRQKALYLSVNVFGTKVPIDILN